jgi:hypothetical protein
LRKITSAFIIFAILVALLFFGSKLIQQGNKISMNNPSPNEGFLANKGEISLLIVSKDINVESIEETLIQNGVDIRNINPILVYDSIEKIQKEHPALEVELDPTFILFDSKSPIFTTNDKQNLVEYLKQQDQLQEN